LIKVTRGEIWEANFEPQSFKSEIGKRGRPALVIQTDLLNNVPFKTTIVIPGTTKLYRDAQGDGFPLQITVPKLGRLLEDTDFVVTQIRAIANDRFLGTAPLATLPNNYLKRVLDALAKLTT
jgi:mRNA interferase MazF